VSPQSQFRSGGEKKSPLSYPKLNPSRQSHSVVNVLADLPQEERENYFMRSFRIFTVHRLLLEWSNQRERNGWYI
jgi:hypothetical protein